MLDWLRQHVLAWTTSAAFTLTMVQMVTPRLFDWIIDALIIGLVYLAAKLSKAAKS